MAQLININSTEFRRCNLSAIQSGGTWASIVPDANEIILISTENALTAGGSGECDAYVVGDGTTAAPELELKSIADNFPSKYSKNAITNKAVSLLVGKDEKTLSGTNVTLVGKNITNVFSDGKVLHYYGANRFDLLNATIQHDGYSSTVITKTATGISINYTGGGTNKSAYFSYTAEFDGNLWVSCVASTQGNIRDLRMLVQKNGTTCAQCYGAGLLRQCVPVTQGDTISVRFLMRASENIANVINYEDIMLSYSKLSEYVPYYDWDAGSSQVLVTRRLPAEQSDWSLYTIASGQTDKGVTQMIDGVVKTWDDVPIPSANSVVPAGLVVNGTSLIAYNAVYNGGVGLGVSNTHKILLHLEGFTTKQQYQDYLAANEINLQYYVEGEIEDYDWDSREYHDGDIITFQSSAVVKYYANENTSTQREKVVCLGDSITGMFGFETDYPSMLSEEGFDAVNGGFSGSCWTDYGTGSSMPFSLNRLIDAICDNDWSLQDAKIGSISTAFYAEHLANLKAVNWNEVSFVTILAGVNDWYYALHPLMSADDPSTTNKQRTNLEDCVPYVIGRLNEAFPNIDVLVLTPYHAFMQKKNSDVDANANGDMLIQYAEVIKAGAEKKRCECIDLYTKSGINQNTMYYFTSDGTHPNERMKHILVRTIAQYINKKENYSLF